jgi:hypothetical protein
MLVYRFGFITWNNSTTEVLMNAERFKDLPWIEEVSGCDTVPEVDRYSSIDGQMYEKAKFVVSNSLLDRKPAKRVKCRQWKMLHIININ